MKLVSFECFGFYGMLEELPNIHLQQQFLKKGWHFYAHND